jgi:hypothetical protein
MTKITVMGNDAGSTNYGYSVIRFTKNRNKIKYKILECGELQTKLKDLKIPPKPALKKYYKEIKLKVIKYKIDHFICERYMPRGRFGNTSEFVNIMIGYLIAKKTPVYLLTASTWKNRLNKFVGKKQVDELSGLSKFYKVVGVPPHEIDATFQAMFLAEKLFKADILDRFSSIKNLIKLKSEIEKCSLSKKIKRKATLVQ